MHIQHESGDDMAINYKKCPQCGALHVINVPYGLPTHEALLKAEEGEIKLGGCCVTGSDPGYHCKNCHCEWNRSVRWRIFWRILKSEYRFSN